VNTTESIAPIGVRERPLGQRLRERGLKLRYRLSVASHVVISVVLMAIGAIATGLASYYLLRIPKVDPSVTWGVLLALFALVHPSLIEVVKRSDRRKPLESHGDIARTSSELLKEALWDRDPRPIYAIAPMIAPGLLGLCESATDPNKTDYCRTVMRSLLDLADRVPVYVLTCKEASLSNQLSDPNAALFSQLNDHLRSERTSGQIFYSGMEELPDFEFLSKAPFALASLRTRSSSGDSIPIGWVSELAGADGIGVQVFLNALRETGNVDTHQLAAVASLVEAPTEEVLLACTLTRFNFFSAVSQIYNRIGRDGTVCIVNESAYPEPKVLHGFENARGQIQILWIPPKDLLDVTAVHALLGMLVRMDLAKRKAERGGSPLTFKSLVYSEAKLKFVAGDQRVVCGNVLHRDSGFGIVLEKTEWVNRVYEHYRKLEKSAHDVNTTVVNLLRHDVESHGGDVEQTTLWREIDGYCAGWRYAYLREGLDMPFNADGLRSQVRELLA